MSLTSRMASVCGRCGGPIQQDAAVLPPPYGSLNAAYPLTLCGRCNDGLVQLVSDYVSSKPTPRPAGEHMGTEVRARLLMIPGTAHQQTVVRADSDRLHQMALWHRGSDPENWAELLPPILDPVLNRPLFTIEYRATWLPNVYGTDDPTYAVRAL